MRLSFSSILLLIILNPYLSLAVSDHTVRRQSCENFFSRVGSKAKNIFGHNLLSNRMGSKTRSMEYSKFNTKWKEWGESILKRNLTEVEAKALSNAYYIRYFTPQNIQPFERVPRDVVELVNFTEDEVKNLLLQERIWILNQAGFTDEEINLLLLEKTKHKNMFNKERHINEQLKNNFNRYDREIGYFNSYDELPEEFQALYKPLDESREQLRESLENGELKEGVSPFIVERYNHNSSEPSLDGNIPYKIVKIDKPNEITVKQLDGQLKTLTNFYISPPILTKSQFIDKERNIAELPQLIDIASPEVSKLFSAIESNRRRVTIEELNLPQKRDLPPPPSSYGPEYTAGWTQIQEGIAFAKAIRELDPLPNPYKTHIEWFVPQISQSIENARQIIRQSQKSLKDSQEAIHQLDLLKQKALQAIQEEEVTYSWWLKFNMELLAVTSNGQVYTYILAHLTKSFPIVIALPIKQTDHKDLSIMSINKAYQNRVAPIEILPKSIMDFDDMSIDPHAFYKHDIAHADDFSDIIRGKDLYYSSFPLIEAEKTHVQFIDSLQGKERGQMENIYFLIRHEKFEILDNSNYVLGLR